MFHFFHSVLSCFTSIIHQFNSTKYSLQNAVDRESESEREKEREEERDLIKAYYKFFSFCIRREFV